MVTRELTLLENLLHSHDELKGSFEALSLSDASNQCSLLIDDKEPPDSICHQQIQCGTDSQILLDSD